MKTETDDGCTGWIEQGGADPVNAEENHIGGSNGQKCDEHSKKGKPAKKAKSSTGAKPARVIMPKVNPERGSVAGGGQRHSNRPALLQVGVIGCGYWGPNLIRNLYAIPGCELKSVCDLDAERLAHMSSLYHGVGVTRDSSALIEDPALDAIVVATPVNSHFPLAKAALLAGKHVLIEKPMAASVEECEDLVRIADERGLTLMVGHTFLFAEPIRKIKEIIDAGDIGELRCINSQRLNLGLFQKDINVAWDLAPHDISIILHVLNECPSVVNCQGNAHVTSGIEDVTNMTLRFQSQHFASIQSSWLEPRKVRQMTFVGSLRMIVYDDLEPLEKIKIYDARVERPPHYDTFAEFQYSYHYGDSYSPHIEGGEPLRDQCEHFLNCIQTGARPLTCGRRGRELVQILEASSKSLMENGAPIAVHRDGDGGGIDMSDAVAAGLIQHLPTTTKTSS